MADRPLVLVSGKDPVASVGGHETYVRAHALAAAAAGFQPHVFCSSKAAGVVGSEFGSIHRVGWRGPGEAPVAGQPSALARAVAEFLVRDPGPHIIHGFGIWAAAAVLATGRLAPRGVHACAVASAYGTRAYELRAMQPGVRAHHGRINRMRYRGWYWWVRTVDDRLEGWGYRHSRVVLVNYESVGRILRAAYGAGIRVRRVPYSDLGAIPTPPPEASVPERANTTREPLVLAVSRHDPRKGLDRLLLALAELARSGVRFRACLIGPGRLLDAHRRLARSLGLQQHVAIPGRVDDVAPYLERADIFVLPSLAEASGSVSVLEALRAGKAIVASACDGIPEDLADGRDALLCAPGNVHDLAAALRTALDDPALRVRLGAGARAVYERRFRPESFLAALAGVYEELYAER
jgi:glycosyltransferase involved in cell wall biosynthesis